MTVSSMPCRAKSLYIFSKLLKIVEFKSLFQIWQQILELSFWKLASFTLAGFKPVEYFLFEKPAWQRPPLENRLGPLCLASFESFMQIQNLLALKD